MRGSCRPHLALFVAPLAAALCAASLSAAFPRPLPAQQLQETATLHWGATVVWLRATDAGTVLVFAAPGYRNAFARPTTLGADEADQWATLIERLTPAGAVHASPVGLVADTGRAIFAGGDIVVEPARSAAGAALHVRLSATRPDGVTATLFSDAAPTAAAALHDAARTARGLHSTVMAAAAAAAIPAPTASPVSTPAPASTAVALTRRDSTTPASAVASATPAAATPTPTHAPAPNPTPTPTPTPPAAVSVVAATAPANSPAATVSAASAPVAPATIAARAQAPIAHRRVARPSFTTPTTPTPSRAGTTARASTATVAAITVRTATPALAQGVDDATVMNLVRQWQPDLQYCYTEYGLRSHPELTGAITLSITLAPRGTVSHVVVARHNWSDDGATEVEACIRSRVAAWYFPPAAATSVHLVPFTFSR